MIEGTLDLEDRGTAASMPHLLLYAGEVARDNTSTPDARANAKRTFDQLFALAASHGFRRSQRLRDLCADGFYASAEAARLARLALDHVPAEAAHAALDRAGFIR